MPSYEMPSRKQKYRNTNLVFLIVLCFGIMFIASACRGTGQQGAAMRVERQPVSEGNIEQGQQLLYDYGCGACHTIPGVSGAHAFVGPPLNDWSQRHYISGRLPNTLDNLIVWIMNPQGIEPGTAMPTMGVSEEEALHMSAYLYSLGN